MYTVAIVITAGLLFILLCGIYFSGLVIHPGTYSHEYTYDLELKSAGLDRQWIESQDREEVIICSPFGYRLYGLFFPLKGAKRTVIMCHGITWTLFGCIKYLSVFRKNGFNVLMIDHRYHGKSGGRNTSFGYYEKYDLKAWTDWVENKIGRGSVIGTLGESMGAAIVLQNAAIDDRVDFCIADCPYSDLTSLFRIRLREDYKLPPFPFLYITELIAMIRLGISFRRVSPIKDVLRIKVPVFFIHGNNDTYIPKEMSIIMHGLKNGPKKLYIAPDAGHVESYIRNPEEYEKLVTEFLEENGLGYAKGRETFA